MSGDMLGLALRDVGGPLKDLYEKLVGKDGETWLRAFKKFLRHEDPWKVVADDFPVWTTIELGICSDRNSFISMLSALECDIGCKVRSLLLQDDFPISSEKTEVDLVCLSFADLGFTRGPDYYSYSQVIQRAEECGLKRCSVEVAPELWIQRNKLLQGSSTTACPYNVASSMFRGFIFALGKHWLGAFEAGASQLQANDRFIFVRPRK